LQKCRCLLYCYVIGEIPKAKNAYRITVDGAGVVNAIDAYMLQQAIERGTRNL
jgi:hypothetical protein